MNGMLRGNNMASRSTVGLTLSFSDGRFYQTQIKPSAGQQKKLNGERTRLNLGLNICTQLVFKQVSVMSDVAVTETVASRSS